MRLPWVKIDPKLAGAVGLVRLLVIMLAILCAWFGVTQRKQNRLLTEANTETAKARDDALNNEDKARRAEKHAIGELAGAMFDRAVVVGEEGEIGQCLVDLAKALDMAEKGENVELAAVIRQNLSGWRRQAHRLADVRSIPSAPSWLAFDSTQSTVLFGTSAETESRHILACDLTKEKPTEDWLKLWKLDEAQFKANNSPTRTAATSPDGTMVLTISMTGAARTFRTDTGQPIGKAITPAFGKFLSGAVFPGGKRILLGDSGGKVTTYTQESGEWVAGSTGRHSLGIEVRAVDPATHSPLSWV